MSELVRVSEHTWMFPHDPDRKKIQPTVGVVASDNATMIYDAGNGPIHARKIKEAIEQENLPPVRYIIYSHHHWDHIFGAQEFPDAEIIAHESALRGIQHYADIYWNSAYIRSQLDEKPWFVAIEWAIDDFEHFEIMMPTHTFTDRLLQVNIDGLSVEIEHVGGKHASDSIVLKVPEDRVMFLADCFYPRPDGIDRISDREVTKTLRSQNYAIHIDGHNGFVWRV